MEPHIQGESIWSQSGLAFIVCCQENLLILSMDLHQPKETINRSASVIMKGVWLNWEERA